MSVWSQIIDQDDVVSTLRHAASTPEAMTHAWLITGPPGSGRSLVARAFAAQLQSGSADSADAQLAYEHGHPDITRHSTDKVMITIEEARSLVEISHRSPVGGKWRIIVVEDADRITERTSNVLLKSIEEPPPRTVWVLCAPSPADMLPTIASRCRVVQLRTPRIERVAQLLSERDGVEPETAYACAMAAGGHVGIARRLALRPGAWEHRQRMLITVANLAGVAGAIADAGELATTLIEAGAEDHSEDLARAREQLLRSLGAEEIATPPPHVRSQLKALEDDYKRRSRRAVADAVDVALLDILSLYRDVLTVQLGTGSDLVNPGLRGAVETIASNTSSEQTVHRMDAIGQTRAQLTEFGSISVPLALEALFLQLRAIT